MDRNMHRIDWRKFFMVNLFLILLGIVMLLFSLGGDISNTDWRLFFQNVAFVFMTIGAVDLLYKIVAKNEELAIIRHTTEEFSGVIERRVKSLLHFNDIGLIGIKDELAFTRDIRDLEEELVFINIFIPDLKQICHILREKIGQGRVRKINLYVLDNRPGSKGAQLLAHRASTYDEGSDLTRYVYENIQVLCSLAQSPEVRDGSLVEFSLHLYNEMPVFALWQFNPKIVNLSFFMYDLRAINATQFMVDLQSGSKFAFEISNHLSYLNRSLKQGQGNIQHSFNLLRDADLRKLRDSQQFIHKKIIVKPLNPEV